MIGEYPFSVQQIQPQIEDVFTKLQTWLHDDAKAILHCYLLQFGVDIVAPPAFVLFSARIFSSAESAIYPALFLLLIHLAMTMHNIPRRIKGRGKQLVILEGDYLYAHLLFILYQTGCLNLLERFSRLIREMNEGTVMRRLYEQGGLIMAGDQMKEILGKQYGLFFAECCDLGGLFAGQQQAEVSLLRQFGNDFGIAYGAQEAGLGPAVYEPLLDQAFGLLDDLQVAKEKDDLKEYARQLVVAPKGLKFRSAVQA
ncbi:MAG: polyprenyl synthetase family protein [Thermacetogeniaceae bacterium]